MPEMLLMVASSHHAALESTAIVVESSLGHSSREDADADAVSDGEQ